MCTKGLVELFHLAAVDKSIQGIKICKGLPYVNHLLFADDSVIFYKANVCSNQKILKIFNHYTLASGQKINTDKTAMVFSHNVSKRCRDEIQSLWGGVFNQQYEKYLSLSHVIGKSKKKAFADIKTKVWKKLHLWKERLIS